MAGYYNDGEEFARSLFLWYASVLQFPPHLFFFSLASAEGMFSRQLGQ